MAIFVSMHDTYLSDSGDAEGMDNVLVYECATFEDAMIVKAIADFGRDEMINAVISDKHERCGSTRDVYWSHSSPKGWLNRWEEDRWGVPMDIDLTANATATHNKPRVKASFKADALGWAIESFLAVNDLEQDNS